MKKKKSEDKKIVESKKLEIKELETENGDQKTPKENPAENPVSNHPKKTALIHREVSTKTFIVSHLSLLIFGLAVFLGLNYYLNRDFSLSEVQKYNPVTKPPSSFNLEINNPDDEMVVFTKDIVITGKTSPSTPVIIQRGDDTFGFESGNKGDFSKVITLVSGLNYFEITAFDDKGNTKTDKRTIYYSEEKL